MKSPAPFLTALLAFWVAILTLGLSRAHASTPTGEPAIVIKSGQLQQQPAADCLSIRGAGSDWLCQGDGAPVITTAPPGSIYLRDDVPLTYLLENNNTTAARVQECTATASYACTLGSNPTIGNVLYAYAYRQGATPAIAAGWTSVGTHSTTDVGMLIACRPVQAGDGKSFTPASGSGLTMGVAIIEVSGVSQAGCANVQSLTYNSARVGSGANNSSTNFTTTSANTLAVGFGSFVKEIGLGANSQTITTGFTNVVESIQGSCPGTWCSTVDVGSQQVASSSTAITLTDTSTYSGSVANEVEVALLVLPSQSYTWLPFPNISGAPTAGDCASWLSSTLLQDVGGVCLTTTGSPANGEIAKFSSAATITNGDLSGDCTTSGTLATTCLKTNGVAFGTAATVNTGTSGATLCLLNGSACTFASAPIFGSLSSGAIQCAELLTTGQIAGTGSACGSGGGGSGTVTSITCNGGLAGGTITVSGTCTLGSITNHALIVGTGSAGAPTVLGTGTAGQPLCSLGSSADPAFQTVCGESVTLSGYSWVNKGTSTDTQTTTGGAILLNVANNAALNWRIIQVAQPSTPYKVVVQIRCGSAYVNSQTCGIYFYDGTKLEGIEDLTQSGFSNTGRVEKITNVNTDDSTAASSTNSAVSVAGVSPEWLQLRNDGATMSFDYSMDGENFVNLFSEAVGTFMTPVDVGAGGVSVNGGSPSLFVDILNWHTCGNVTLSGGC
jgi:hypothetical protein